MASKREIKRFAFKLDRKLIKYEKVMQNELYSELLRQQKIAVSSDAKIKSKTSEIILKAYETIGVEIAEQQYKALGSIFKKDRFFLEGWKTWIDDFAKDRIAQDVKNMDNWTNERLTEIKGQIKESIRESGLSIPRSEVERLIHEKSGKGIFSKSRARTIARTETAMAANNSKVMSADLWQKETGLKQSKMWVHRGAKDPRDSHVSLDGVIIPADEKFQIIGGASGFEEADYPHAQGLSAENVVNCSCQVVYVSQDYADAINGVERTPESDAQAPQANETVTIEDLPPSTEQTIRDDIKDAFKGNDIGIKSVTFDSGLSIGDKNILKNQISKLTKEYKLDSKYNGADDIKLRFKSSSRQYGSVQTNTFSRKVTSINFGHKYDIDRAGELRASLDKYGRITAHAKSKVDAANVKVSTLTHEFGHIIASPHRSGNSDFFEKLNKIRISYHKDVNVAVNAKDVDGLSEIFLGNYASTNISEFLAEGFTEYKLHSNPSKYALKIGRLIDKHFKK